MEPVDVLPPPEGGEPGGYYPRFALPEPFGGPAELRDLLADLWDQHGAGRFDARAACEAVLLHLWPEREEEAGDARTGWFRRRRSDPRAGDGYRRALRMGDALGKAMAAQARVYLPGNQRPEIAADWVGEFLGDGELTARSTPDDLFPDEPQPSPAADDVHVAHRALYGALAQPERARSWLGELCWRCLEREAVLSGDDQRKDLVRWWIVQVVPAAYAGSLPRIYTRDWPWPPSPPGPATRPEPPDRLRIEAGIESFHGRDQFEVTRDGGFRYEARYRGAVVRSAAGRLDPQWLGALHQALRDSRFPQQPPWPDLLPPDTSIVDITASWGDEHEDASVIEHEAARFIGYAEVVSLFARWCAALAEGNDEESARLGLEMDAASDHHDR